jgi:hypothetical protein
LVEHPILSSVIRRDSEKNEMREIQQTLPSGDNSDCERQANLPLRRSIPLLVLLFLLGCMSAIVAGSGPDLSTLATRHDVIETLGEPRASGHTESGSFDRFKIRNYSKAGSDILAAFCMVTFGTADVVAFPFVLFDAVSAHDVKFLYDASESVINYEVDGSLNDYNEHLNHRPFGT